MSPRTQYTLLQAQDSTGRIFQAPVSLTSAPKEPKCCCCGVQLGLVMFFVLVLTVAGLNWFINIEFFFQHMPANVLTASLISNILFSFAMVYSLVALIAASPKHLQYAAYAYFVSILVVCATNIALQPIWDPSPYFPKWPQANTDQSPNHVYVKQTLTNTIVSSILGMLVAMRISNRMLAFRSYLLQLQEFCQATGTC